MGIRPGAVGPPATCNINIQITNSHQWQEWHTCCKTYSSSRRFSSKAVLPTIFILRGLLPILGILPSVFILKGGSQYCLYQKYYQKFSSLKEAPNITHIRNTQQYSSVSYPPTPKIHTYLYFSRPPYPFLAAIDVNHTFNFTWP